MQLSRGLSTDVEWQWSTREESQCEPHFVPLDHRVLEHWPEVAFLSSEKYYVKSGVIKCLLDLSK